MMSLELCTYPTLLCSHKLTPVPVSYGVRGDDLLNMQGVLDYGTDITGDPQPLRSGPTLEPFDTSKARFP